MNASSDHIDKIKQIASNQDSLDYLNVEEIHLNNVVLHDGENESEKEILIRELIILNTPDDDPDDATVIVNKAVIVPSLTQDHTIERLRSKLMKRATKKLNSQLDQLSKMLAKLKFSPKLMKKVGRKNRRKRKKLKNQVKMHKKFVKKQLREVEKQLGKLKVPVMKTKRAVHDLSKEMREFDRELDFEVSRTFGLINQHKKHKDIKSMLKKLKKMKTEMKSLKKAFLNKMSKKGNTEAVKHKIEVLAKQMGELNRQVQRVSKESLQEAEKVKQQRHRIRQMMYEHGENVENVMMGDGVHSDASFFEKSGKRLSGENVRKSKKAVLGKKGFKLAGSNTD